MPRRCAAIVNPAAGARASKVLPELQRSLPNLEVRYTQAPGHATELTRELLRSGFDCIVAVGGDGTVNEIVNGFLDTSPPEAALAVLPLGTGGDFRRSLAIRNCDQTLNAILHSPPRMIDAGQISYVDATGVSRNRYFANVVSFGMGGEVAARARNPLHRIGGKIAFFYATMAVFLRYRAIAVDLELDGRPAGTHSILNIAVGNGRYHGGGMHVCPRALLDDGLLDITVIDSLSFLELLRNVRSLYSDDLYVCSKTHHYRALGISARASERPGALSAAKRVAIEVDGEPLGFLPVTIQILPAALRVFA